MKLWTNGYIHKEDGSIGKNLLTDNGLIVGIDCDDSIYQEVIDLNGAHLYPGFTDSHLHLIGYGQYLSRIDIRDHDKWEILELILKSNANPVVLDGYQDKIGITHSELNEVSKDKPVLLRYDDFHSMLVNQYVLKELNIIGDGKLTEDLAQKAIKRYLNETNETLEQYLIRAIESLYQFGITGGHSDDLYYFNGYKNTLNVFKTVLEKYKFRTQLLVHHKVLNEYLNDKPSTNQEAFLEFGGVKVFYDGTITSKTALMTKGYKNETSMGLRVTDNFESIVKKVRQLGLTLAVHVIGDQGLDECLEILKKYPPKINQKDRLIHTPWISENGINKIKNMPLTIDAQPQFLHSDLPLALNLFNEKPTYIFPWKTLIKQGLEVSFSSDAPVEVPNPLLGIYYAVNRTGKDLKLYDDEESLSVEEAVLNYTKFANAQTIQKNRGSIKIGYVADFTVFEQDLSKVPIEALKSMNVLMTVIDEQIVYEKKQS